MFELFLMKPGKLQLPCTRPAVKIPRQGAEAGPQIPCGPASATSSSKTMSLVPLCSTRKDMTLHVPAWGNRPDPPGLVGPLCGSSRPGCSGLVLSGITQHVPLHVTGRSANAQRRPRAAAQRTLYTSNAACLCSDFTSRATFI